MLGKTAGGLTWMFRYLERSENIARLVEAGFRMGLTHTGDASEWESIVATAAVREAYLEQHEEFEVSAILFVFASFLLGDIHGYYERFWWWDLLLHGSSGVLLGLAGFLLIYILNSEEKVHVNLKPFFVILFSFTFAIAIGAAWEIFEFAMDSFFGLNMQKSGLVDTMWDLIVDTGGALISSIGAYFYIKRGTPLVDTVVKRFINENPKIFLKK